MANRYWVGGTGTWSSGSTTNWSATSGGASGASVPGASDAVIFDGSSGTGTVTLNYNPTIQTLNTSLFPSASVLNCASATITLNSVGTVLTTRLGSLNRIIGTPNITLSSTSGASRTLILGQNTYGTISIGGTTGSSTTTLDAGSTTVPSVIGTLTSTKTVAHTIEFTDVDLYTIDTFTVSGSAGNIVTINGASSNISATKTFLSVTNSSTLNYVDIANVYLSTLNTLTITNGTVFNCDGVSTGTGATAYTVLTRNLTSPLIVPRGFNTGTNTAHLIGGVEAGQGPLKITVEDGQLALGVGVGGIHK